MWWTSYVCVSVHVKAREREIVYKWFKWEVVVLCVCVCVWWERERERCIGGFAEASQPSGFSQFFHDHETPGVSVQWFQALTRFTYMRGLVRREDTRQEEAFVSIPCWALDVEGWEITERQESALWESDGNKREQVGKSNNLINERCQEETYTHHSTSWTVTGFWSLSYILAWSG